MGDQETKQPGPGFALSNIISLGKDAVALLRDTALLLLVVLLLRWPETFNGILVQAGFEEGSLVGMKWKAKVSKQDSELIAAQAALSDLRTQNSNLKKALDEAKAHLSDPSLKSKIAELELINAQVMPDASEVQRSLQTTIASNTSLVQRLQSAADITSTWAVVFSGDSTLDSARYETDTAAPKLGIKNAAIYYRQGSYRSVAIASDRGQANEFLTKLKGRRADAYIVDMSKWCPKPIEKDGYFECGA